ncbi:murein biosynthesis integral membrane protein MurJ [Acidipropionibacterium timonense]|uniref:murein biosynthesis integral membrane protein MurJ n=1 Tax=Acidipropionibacterium timonense TaxID=2161818 RepID=UPI001FD9D002|nr:murein biosynthesis integral membrane protein MurJ [Acidipropionibacterium timonense]
MTHHGGEEDGVDVYDLLRVPDLPNTPDVYDFLDVDATMLGSDLVAQIRRLEDDDTRADLHVARRKASAPLAAEDPADLETRSGSAGGPGPEQARPDPSHPGQARPESSLRRASMVMAAGTMVSRVLGFVRTFLLTAIAGGTSLALDSFQAANTLPNVVFILLSAGVLNAILIPQITKAMKRPDGGQDFVDRLLTASFAAVLVVTVIATATSPWLLDAYFSSSGVTRHLTVFFGFICMPQIFFYGLYAILGQVLNARGQFAAFMWSPVLANIVQITGLVWFLVQFGAHPDPATWTSQMVWVLAGTTTLGIVLQGVFLIIPLRRGGFRWRPRWGVRGYGLGAAARITVWTFSALVVSQIAGILTKKILSWVRLAHPEVSGSVAAYDNAFLVFMLPHSFITTSILTALFPRMSRAHADADAGALRVLVRKGMTAPAVAIIPCSLAMVVLAKPGVQTIFRLQSGQVDVLAWAVAIMGLGLLPFGVSTLQQRYCFAREDGRQNFNLQLVLSGTQLAIVLLVLVAPPSSALLVVAAAQTVANTVVSVVWARIASRQMDGLGMRSVAGLWGRLLAASVAAAVPTWFAVQGMSMLGSRWIVHALTTGVCGVLYVAIFVGCARLLHIDEVDEIVAPVLRRVHLAR